MPEFLFTPTPDKDAKRFIAGKAAVSSAVFEGLLPELRPYAFTVAGVENIQILKKLRDRVAQLPEGADWNAIKGDLAKEISPWLGNDRAAGLRRAETLLRTHGYQAFGVTHYNVLQRQTDVFPWWEYDTADDEQVRSTHRALDGKIFPANSQFWIYHFPPWEWGCRCNVIARSADDVAEIEAADARKIPEARRVIKGDRLTRAENDGVLIIEENGIPRMFDIRAPRQKFGGSGYSFDPSALEISLEDLKGRYVEQPETWATFETWAKKTKVTGQKRTVWEWLDGKPVAPRPRPLAPPVAPPIAPPIAPPAPIVPVPPRIPIPPAPAPAAIVPVPPRVPVAPKPGVGGPPVLAPARTIEESLQRIGLPLDRPATADDMRALLSELREEAPVKFNDVVRAVRGRATGNVSTDNLTKWTKEFLDMVPPEIARQLPTVEVIAAPINERGTYNRGGTVKISTAIASEEQARRTLWHELTHWLHRDRRGDDSWVQAITAHFTARTAGDELAHLASYGRSTYGKRDQWYEVYAGRIYLYAEEATHLGLEVPTRYAELLTMRPEELAKFWNDPSVRETLLIVLRGFYPTPK